jgi:hypothetical protein
MRAGCAPTVAGNLGVVVASNGRLLLQGFDYERTAPKGSPVALGMAPISDNSVGQPLASASRNGVIVHFNEPLENTELAWLDRSGRYRGSISLPRARYEWGVGAPDGNPVARGEARIANDGRALAHRSAERPIQAVYPGNQSRFGGITVWSPDGTRIAFSSNRNGSHQHL